MPRSPSPYRYKRDYKDLDNPRSRSPPRRHDYGRRRYRDDSRERRRDDHRDDSRERRYDSRERRYDSRERRQRDDSRGRRRSPRRRSPDTRGRARHRSRSYSPDYHRKSTTNDTLPQEEQEQKEENEEEMDEETKMMRLMGFGGFDTTKNKKVPGTDVSGAKIRKPLKYRQYMNRRGGFNRPLDG